MKTSELRQKDAAGLQTEIKELQKAHFNMRMQKATQQLNNTAQMKVTRRSTSPCGVGSALSSSTLVPTRPTVVFCKSFTASSSYLYLSR